VRREIVLAHEFVEFIPKDIKERVVYVSIRFATVVHKCCCGCGNEVVTPLTPTDWKLIFDGKTISLDPSIGNWGFKCQSHYWIRNNRVRWAARWSKDKIDAGRAYDRYAKERYFDTANGRADNGPKNTARTAKSRAARPGIWHKLKNWLQT
jgi:hypothetical protein